jgi:hypothetical protein
MICGFGKIKYLGKLNLQKSMDEMKSEKKSFVDMCTREDEIFTKVGFGKEKS